MKRILLLLTFIIGVICGYSQDKPKKENLQDAKSQMVLRGTSRDQMYMVKDNFHNKQTIKRRQVTINRQQMMIKKRMHQMHHQKLNRQRNIQMRKIRQQATRRQQMRRR